MNDCYRCTERRVGCHSECEKYRKWCEAEQKRKSAEDAADYNQRLHDDYVLKSKERYKKRMGKK